MPMGYDVYLDSVLLPVTPGKLQLKVTNTNKTVSLISEGQVNLLKSPGLTEISFTALIPQTKLPFSRGDDGAQTYLDKLEALKVEKGPFQFIVSRMGPGGASLFHTNLKVSLEDYQVTEDAKQYGIDLCVDIKLKQYRDYGTKKVVVQEQQQVPTANVQEQRPAESAPKQSDYTVVAGDCLWNIAKRLLGDGSRYNEIYEMNKDQIKNPNLIYPGQTFKLPGA